MIFGLGPSRKDNLIADFRVSKRGIVPYNGRIIDGRQARGMDPRKLKNDYENIYVIANPIDLDKRRHFDAKDFYGKIRGYGIRSGFVVLKD